MEMDSNNWRQMHAYSPTCILGTYVDDLLIACNDKKLLDEFREKSTKQFQITHSEGCDDFVGIQIENTEDYFKLHMTKHIDGLANKFTHITRNEKVHTPLPPNIHFEANAEQADDEDVSLFRSMIGKILYISLMVRLDAAYAVSVLSQYMLNPGKQHFDAIHHLINYLINTKTIGLEYLKNHSHKTCKHPHTLMGMVDASYGGHMHTHKSHTGMVHIATNGIIHYRSMAQKTNSTSSSHAEAKAAFSMAKETLAIKGFWTELESNIGHIVPINTASTTILVDNRATVDLFHDPKSTEKSRHWLLAYTWVKELQLLGLLKFKWINGKQNLSDLLTKPVSGAVFNELGPLVGDSSSYHEFIGAQS